MVRAIRDTQAALGDGVKRMRRAEADLYVTARRSLFAAARSSRDAVIGGDDVAVLRPGTGIEVATSTRSSAGRRATPDRAARAAAWDMF